MSAEEDTELRDLIIQTLENNGVIGKIKAELRASVFLALEEEGSFRDKIPLVNTRLMQFMSKPDGVLVVSLIREFLQFFNLNFTLAVFEPEITASYDFLSKEEIRRKLKLVGTDLDSPVLSDLVKLTSKQQDTSDFDSKKITESSVMSAETKTSENESKMLRLATSTDSLTANASDKFSEINYENPSKSHEASRDFTINSGDPFFDEPLPLEKRPYFSIGKEDSQKDGTATGLNEEHDIFGSKIESKGLEKSCLTSLKDLPSLNTQNNKVSDWGLGKSLQKKVSSVDLDVHSGEGEYDDEDFHSSGSGQSAKSSQNSINMMGQPKTDGTDNQDNSEQSIEEEIEEDLSGGVDDLLNSSLSLGEDATSDQTISQVSFIGGSDYMESCNPPK